MIEQTLCLSSKGLNDVIILACVRFDECCDKVPTECTR